jgi:glycosyltransferase involved in cell wall biosynthesis
VRFLLAIANTYTDQTSGAARSVRTIMEWLCEGGHECRVLSTARFEAVPRPILDDHLAQLGIPLAHLGVPSWAGAHGRAVTEFTLAGVRVTVIATRYNDPARPNRRESAQFLQLFDDALVQFRPDLVLTYGGHPALREALRRAREQAVTTVFTLRNYGYEDRRFYRHVDHVLMNSAYLARHYGERIGLKGLAIPSPIAWNEVLAPEETRGFVTFVNPSLHKGAALFARLADMLGRARPDIPLLIVQSASDASALASIPGLDLAQYPQILVSQPIARPAEIFALTRLLLVPSTFAEPFGRVAAEAMINGVPALVSDRGALPETVEDGGRVLPLPAWLDATSRRVPSEEEVRPWFDAICRLWDDDAAYRAACEAARQAAKRLYDERTLRRRYIDYFTSLRPGGMVFDG